MTKSHSHNDPLKEQWLTLIDRFGERYIGSKINSGWGFTQLREYLQAEQTRTSEPRKPSTRPLNGLQEKAV